MRSAWVWLPVILLSACDGEFGTSTTHQCRSGVVTVDKTAIPELLQRCGPPEHIEPIENRYGAALGERWIYSQDGRTVHLIVRDGRLRRIDVVD